MLGGNLDGLEVLDAIRRRLAGLEHPDLAPLAETCKGIMIEDNRRGLMAGTDGRGAAFVSLSGSSSRRDGVHSPLLPDGEASPMIRDYQASVLPDGVGLVVRAGWDPAPRGLAFTVAGTEHQPARDPRGLRPQGQEEIRRALDDFAGVLIGGRP